jgi:hypothetical protein
VARGEEARVVKAHEATHRKGNSSAERNPEEKRARQEPIVIAKTFSLRDRKPNRKHCPFSLRVVVYAGTLCT